MKKYLCYFFPLKIVKYFNIFNGHADVAKRYFESSYARTLHVSYVRRFIYEGKDERIVA